MKTLVLLLVINFLKTLGDKNYSTIDLRSNNQMQDNASDESYWSQEKKRDSKLKLTYTTNGYNFPVIIQDHTWNATGEIAMTVTSNNSTKLDFEDIYLMLRHCLINSLNFHFTYIYIY